MSVALVKKLYYENGLSCKEIGAKTNLTTWQVIYIMRKNQLKLRSSAETQRIQFSKKPLTYNKIARLFYKDKYLQSAGLMLYWAEGNKSTRTVDLANSDPKIIKIFLSMLRNIYRVDEKKIRVLLYCHSNQNPKRLINYWSKLTNIPINHFTKPYIRKGFRRKQKGKMPYGLVHIRYNDKRLFMQIQNEIGIIAAKLLKPR